MVEPHVLARLTQLDEVLKQTGANYQNRERLRSDVASLLRAVHTLQPRTSSFSNGGRTVELFYLYGVLPIKYKGAMYNVPVTFYFDQPYPSQPPRCFVTPSPGMALKPRHQHVDEGGMIRLPYLASWRDSTSTLPELVDIVTGAFSAAPPVYSTGSGSRPPPRSTQARGSSATWPREQPNNLPRSRRDILVQNATEALRDRWETAIAPVVADLSAQLEFQRELLENPHGIEDDPDTQQVLDCLAEELALDELLASLDELLAARKISLEGFLREVREASRRQFLCRAQRLKSASACAAAAPAPEAADTVAHLPKGGEQALRATGTEGLAQRLPASRRL